VAHIPGFPVKFGGVDALYAAFLNESRTRSRLLDAHTGNPGISLVFREMWDTTKLNHKLSRPRGSLKARPVVSHISRKTSEIWATRRFEEGKELKVLDAD
jgi:hypothetical protein